MKVDVGNLLPYVRRPTSYAGHELNAVMKSPDSARARIALGYPDRYDIGMSNMGVRILYHLLNRLPAVACERFFAPWPDMENMLRTRGVPLFTLESRSPVREFDAVAFSIGYELTYTNILSMLDLSGIPLLSADRKENDPVVIAGGPCCLNPEPLAEFIDCFFIGDGEEVAKEIGDVLVKRMGRRDTLEALSGIQGSYAPIIAGAGKTKRRVSPRLDPEDYPLAPLVPNCEIAHDRLTIEIMRGCPRSCKFCQSTALYGPVRQRTPEEILELSREGIKNSGWEEMSLVSLSPTDYPNLGGLLRELGGMLERTRTSLSLSSVRADSLTDELASALSIAKKTSITLAPEAGTERLRSTLGKPMSDDSIVRSAGRAFSLGYNRLKLYFIIGLPRETGEDLDAVGSLSRAIASQTRDGRVKLSLSGFVPKPHTPFEREAQESIDELYRKARHIRAEAKSRRIEVNWHDPRTSFLEAVMSRGDRSLSGVILGAFRKGCRFDGWTESLEFDKWMSAFDEAGIDPHRYASSMAGIEKLPWSFIDMESATVLERCRAVRAVEVGGELPHPQREPRRHIYKELKRPGRYRVKYSKLEEAKFTSHLDVMRAVARALRRAGIPLAYSQGFSTRPRISFGPPLSVGMTSSSEYFDLVTEGTFQTDLMTSIDSALPSGLKVISVTPIFMRARSLSDILDVAEYRVSNIRLSPGLVEDFLSSQTREILQTRGDKKRLIDVRPLLLDIKNEDGSVLLQIRMPKTGWVGPREILSAIEGEDEESFLGAEIERTGLFTYRRGVLLTPTAEKGRNE